MTVMAKALALAGGRPDLAARLAEEMRASPRVVKALKSAVWSGDEDAPGLVDARTISTAFIAQLRNRSIFYALQDAGMVRVPFYTRVSFSTYGATAFVAGEGGAVPISGLGVDFVNLKPVTVCGLCLFAKEIIESTGSAGEALITRELRRAVVHTVDEEFLDLVIDQNTPTATSSGDAVADVKALLDAVEPTAESRLVFALAPDVARQAATLTTLTGGYVFPDFEILGGQIRGVPAIASDALPAGSMVLLDGTGIAGDADLITVDASDETTIEIEPDGSGDGPDMISCFQDNLVAILARAAFGAVRFRENAVAQITDITWGDAGSS